jgi:Flp pilus assembly pilin Flp
MRSIINPDSKGQGFLEYAMILFLVVVVVIIVVFWLGPAVGNLYSNIMINFPQ